MKLLRFWLQWIVINGSVVALLIAGLHAQQGWAWNLARCVIALTAAVYGLCLMTWNFVPKEQKLKRALALPGERHLVIDLCYDLALSAMLAGYGQFWWATVNLVQAALCNRLLAQYYALRDAAG